jgi:hypothetical protein
VIAPASACRANLCEERSKHLAGLEVRRVHDERGGTVCGLPSMLVYLLRPDEQQYGFGLKSSLPTMPRMCRMSSRGVAGRPS